MSTTTIIPSVFLLLPKLLFYCFAVHIMTIAIAESLKFQAGHGRRGEFEFKYLSRTQFANSSGSAHSNSDLNSVAGSSVGESGAVGSPFQ